MSSYRTVSGEWAPETSGEDLEEHLGWSVYVPSTGYGTFAGALSGGDENLVLFDTPTSVVRQHVARDFERMASLEAYRETLPVVAKWYFDRVPAPTAFLTKGLRHMLESEAQVSPGVMSRLFTVSVEDRLPVAVFEKVDGSVFAAASALLANVEVVELVLEPYEE